MYTEILHCYTEREQGLFLHHTHTHTKKPRVHKIHSCFTTCSCSCTEQNLLLKTIYVFSNCPNLYEDSCRNCITQNPERTTEFSQTMWQVAWVRALRGLTLATYETRREERSHLGYTK